MPNRFSTATARPLAKHMAYGLRLTLLLCCLVLLPFEAPVAQTDGKQQVSIGILAYRTLAETRQQWQPLAEYLNWQLPAYRFHIHAYDYRDLESAIRTRKIDFVFTNPAHYILLAEKDGLSAPLVTLINEEFGRQLPAFGGTILVRNEDTQLQQLSDLKNKRIASPSHASLGGHMMQRYEIHLQEPRETQLNMHYTGMPHETAIVALLDKEVDAAFVRSGVMELMLEKGRLAEGQLRVLNPIHIPHFPYALSTRLYPEWPLAAIPHTSDDLARQLAATLLALPHGSESAQSMGIYGFSIPMDYKQVRELMQAMRMSPFNTAPVFTSWDIWQRYRSVIIILLLAGLIIGVLLAFLLFNRKKLQQQTLHAEQQAQQRLSAEQRLEAYFEVSPVIVYTLVRHTDGLHTRWISANISRLLGYSIEEASADGWWMANIHPDDRDQASQQLNKLETQHSLRHEYRFYKKDRSLIWVLDQVRLFTTPDLKTNIMGAWTDITERELARQAIETEANERRMLLSSLGEGVYGTDINGICTFINPAALEMLGYPEEEVLGQHQHLIFHHHYPDGSHYPATDCPIQKTLQDGKTRHEEEWFIRRDGSGMEIDLTVTAVESNGVRLGCVAAFRDISQRKLEDKTLRELSQFRQAILDHNAAAIFVGSADRHIRMTNRRAQSLFGYTADELNNASFRLIHVDDEHFTRFSTHYQDFGSSKEITEAAWPFRHRNGSIIWCEAYGALLNPDRIEDGVIWTLIDVTAERTTAERNRLMVAALEAAANAIVITDTEANIEWANQAFETLTGFTAEEAIGHKPSELIGSGEQDKEFYKKLWKTILGGETWRGEVINRKKSGELYHEELIIAPVKNDDDRIEHFVGVKQDITARKQLEQELEQMATTDFLTGLPNRRHFIARMDEELARLQRLNGHDTALLMLDIDHFKEINDQYSHATGDKVLQGLAKLINLRLRRTDMAGRLGGEEFAILLPGADLEKGRQFAEELREQVSELVFEDKAKGSSSFSITISIGVCELDHENSNPDAPLARADKAMYQAKNNGRNRVEVADSE